MNNDGLSNTSFSSYTLHKILPHSSLIRMAKLEAVPFHRFQLPLPQKFATSTFLGVEVWNRIWKKILEWNGRSLVWNGNRMQSCWYGIWKNHFPFHTMPCLLVRWLLLSMPILEKWVKLISIEYFTTYGITYRYCNTLLSLLPNGKPRQLF